MNRFQIGVVIPLFNRSNTVRYAMESIWHQSHLPDRVVIVDDGSTDDSYRSVVAWVENHPHPFDVRVLRQANAGVSSARNRGLQLTADCRYVTFLDSDDVWPRDFLASAISRLSANPMAVAATCGRLSVNDRGTSHRETLEELESHPVRWFVRHGAGISSCTVLATEPLLSVGGFPEELQTGEDTATYLRLSLLGTWLHVPNLYVEFNRFRPTIHGEEGSLSRRYSDNHRRWALVYEDFLGSRDGVRYQRDPEIRKNVARFWYRAGRELVKNGYPADAYRCFMRSLRWYRWNWKNWLNLIVAQSGVHRRTLFAR